MPATERYFPAPILAGRAGFIPAPFQFVLTGEDHLLVSALNFIDDLTLIVEGRFLRAGEAHPEAFSHSEPVPAQSAAHTTFAIPMTAGVLLNASVRAEGAMVLRGDCYVRVDVIRGLTGARMLLGTLLAGYVGLWDTIAWPGSIVESALAGPGHVRRYTDVVPAAGESTIIAIPFNTRVRIIAAWATLTTNATVGNRNVFLRATSNGATVFQAESTYTQPASQARAHYFGAGAAAPAGLSGLQGAGSLPAGFFLDGLDGSPVALTMFASGMQAGDQFSALTALWEEWRSPSASIL